MQEFEDDEEIGDKQDASAATPRASAPAVEGGGLRPPAPQAGETKGSNGVAALRGAVSTMTKARPHTQIAPASKKQKVEAGGCPETQMDIVEG